MNEKGRRIRNGQIRRDFKRLLTIIAEASDLSGEVNEDFRILSEVEEIASRNAFYFDDNGSVKEEPEVERNVRKTRDRQSRV